MKRGLVESEHRRTRTAVGRGEAVQQRESFRPAGAGCASRGAVGAVAQPHRCRVCAPWRRMVAPRRVENPRRAVLGCTRRKPTRHRAKVQLNLRPGGGLRKRRRRRRGGRFAPGANAHATPPAVRAGGPQTDGKTCEFTDGGKIASARIDRSRSGARLTRNGAGIHANAAAVGGAAVGRQLDAVWGAQCADVQIVTRSKRASDANHVHTKLHRGFPSPRRPMPRSSELLGKRLPARTRGAFRKVRFLIVQFDSDGAEFCKHGAFLDRCPAPRRARGGGGRCAHAARDFFLRSGGGAGGSGAAPTDALPQAAGSEGEKSPARVVFFL